MWFEINTTMQVKPEEMKGSAYVINLDLTYDAVALHWENIYIGT